MAESEGGYRDRRERRRQVIDEWKSDARAMWDAEDDKRNILLRDCKLAALARLEDAARTVADFENIIVIWDQLDLNREERESNHEVVNTEVQHVLYHTTGSDEIIPPPFCHPYWRELLRGDFISYIYDNPEDFWQTIGDGIIAKWWDGMNAKHRETVFLHVIRRRTTEQIACLKDMTDRGVRKRIAAALEVIRGEVAAQTQYRNGAGLPVTNAKKRFLEWYDGQAKTALDKDKGG
jgi:hypothetical protein